MAFQYAGVFLAAYLLGAIPFGFIIGRLSRGVDVREYGSGRMGATNVQRTVGTWAGVAVFLADLAKGVGAVLLARVFLDVDLVAVGVGLVAIAGHNWPIFLRFRGGRGVTTSLGGLTALSWPIGLLAFGLGVGIIALSRYVSLGSMMGSIGVALVVLVLVVLGRQPLWLFLYAGPMAGLIVFQHRDNISRLRLGQERKLGQAADRRV